MAKKAFIRTGSWYLATNKALPSDIEITGLLDSVTAAHPSATQGGVAVASNFADDAAAAVGGIPVGGRYHTAGAVKIRLA